VLIKWIFIYVMQYIFINICKKTIHQIVYDWYVYLELNSIIIIFSNINYLNKMVLELVDSVASIEGFVVSSSPKNDHNERLIRFSEWCIKRCNPDGSVVVGGSEMPLCFWSSSNTRSLSACKIKRTRYTNWFWIHRGNGVFAHNVLFLHEIISEKFATNVHQYSFGCNSRMQHTDATFI